MKKLLLYGLVACMSLTASAAESSYSIQFKVNPSDKNQGETISTTTELDAIVETGAEYLSGVKSATRASSATPGGMKIGTNKQTEESNITFTLSAEGTKNVTKIVVNGCMLKNASKVTDVKINNVSGTPAWAKCAEATPNAAELEAHTYEFDGSEMNEITIAGTYAFYVNTLTVYYEDGEVTPPAVERPDIKQVATDTGYAIEMTCATEGAQIYYFDHESTDVPGASNGATLYTAPVAVNGGAYTFVAAAYKDADVSKTATLSGNAPYVMNTFDIADKKGSNIDVRADIKAIYQNDDYVYVTTDNTYALLYKPTGYADLQLKNGDSFQQVTATVGEFRGTPQLNSATIVGDITRGGTPVEPQVITLDKLTAELVNHYVKIENVNLSAANKGNSTMTDAAGNTGALYHRFYKAPYEIVDVPNEATDNVTVVGFVGMNNETVQVIPTAVTVNTEVEKVAAPAFSPAAGEVEKGTTVTLSCATEGATIYYSTTDGEVVTEGAEYTEPIVINEAVTIYAVATKDGMEPSEKVSAAYTVKTEGPEIQDGIATFDFSTAEKCTAYGITVPTEGGKGTDLCAKGADVTYTSGIITMKVAVAEDAQVVSRIWAKADGEALIYDMRLYAGTTVEFASTDVTKEIKKITFEQNKSSYDFGSSNTYAPNTFVATGDQNPKELVWNGGTDDKPAKNFTMGIGAKTFFSKVNVEFVTPSGVGEIVEESDAEAVYYNLQGVRVNNPEKGLYIRVKGNKSEKVML